MKQPQMQTTLYHSLLRISAVVFAVALVFDSGMALPVTKQLSEGTQQYVANMVSVSVGIPENEINTITAELTQQKLALEAREQELIEREISLSNNETTEASDVSTYILSTILFILLVLIVLNYGLDYVRMRRLSEQAHA